MAIRTLCIRPDDYEDTKLFVPCSTYQDVCGALTSFLDNKGIKRRRLLVHGERGIGKSICVRAAISELEQEREDFFPITVPGDRCTTVKHLICQIGEELARQARQHFSGDKDMLRQTLAPHRASKNGADHPRPV